MRIKIQQKLSSRVELSGKLAKLGFVGCLTGRFQGALQLFDLIHCVSLARGRADVKALQNARGATFSRSREVRAVAPFQFGAYCQDQGMIWIQIIVSKIIDWLLQLPPDLLSRRVEKTLDRIAERRKRPRRVGARRTRNSKK